MTWGLPFCTKNVRFGSFLGLGYAGAQSRAFSVFRGALRGVK